MLILINFFLNLVSLWQVVWTILQGTLKTQESALPIQNRTYAKMYVNHTAGIGSTMRYDKFLLQPPSHN